MTQAYGHDHFAGLGQEADWGSAAARDAFFSMLEDGIKAKREKKFSTQFRQLTERRYIRGLEGADGGFALEGNYESRAMALLLLYGLGSVTSEQLTAGVYRHIFRLTNERPAGLTLENHKGAWDPELNGGAGGLSSFLYNGGAVTDLVLAMEIDDYLMVKPTMSFKDESLVAASSVADEDFPADQPVAYEQAEFSIDGFVIENRKFEMNLKSGLDSGRRALGSRNILRQIIGGVREITGSAELYLESLTQYHKFARSEEIEVLLEFTGSQIAEGYNRSLSIRSPRCVLTGETPSIGGPGWLPQPLTWKALYDVDEPEDALEIILVNEVETIDATV